MAITSDVSDVMTRPRMLPSSWVGLLTCCTKPEVPSKSAKLVASVQLTWPISDIDISIVIGRFLILIFQL